MIDHADAEHGRHNERAGKTKRVEERQNAQDVVAPAERKGLAQLIGVGDDIVVRQHHPLWIARAAAGENDRGQIVKRAPLLATDRPLQHPRR